MDLIKYLSLLVVCFFDTIEAGGHKGSHDHIKLYVPEFHHHKHHTKYITIHHHQKKPKKHHHHHIHIPKSPPPHHHYGFYHTKKGHKTTLKTTTTHVSPSHHTHGHHDSSTSYESPTYGGNYSPISHAAPQIPQIPSPRIPHIPTAPKVHGVSHTVKNVKVYDSLPGAIQGAGNGNGYKVTEEPEDDDDDDDSFTSVNDVQNIYPSTFNFLHGDSANNKDPFVLSDHGVNTHNPFSTNQQSFGAADAFIGHEGSKSFGSNEFQGHEGQDFSGLSGQHGDYPSNLGDTVAINFGGDASAFDSGMNSFPSAGTGIEGGYLSANEKFGDDSPVTFTREAGVQQTLNTGSQHSVVY